jgi:hypothetical protein
MSATYPVRGLPFQVVWDYADDPRDLLLKKILIATAVDSVQEFEARPF